jgi:hypothetical protein
MKKHLLKIYFGILLSFFPFVLMGQNVWINEIHYDNAGTDANEGVEIAGTAGTDLTGWQVIPYNGSNGQTYSPIYTFPSVIIPDQQNGFGAIWVNITGLQNGSPDGVALVKPDGTVVQFLSYEGTFVATNGPANGQTSIDIGVSETGSEPAGNSLQLMGTGSAYADFVWAGSSAHTRGAINNNQTMTLVVPDTDPPVWTEDYPAPGTILDNKGSVKVSLDEPGVVYYVVLFAGATPPTSAQVMAAADYDTVHVLRHDTIIVKTALDEYTEWISGAVPGASYDIWLVAEDDESTPNVQADPVLLQVTMSAERALEITNPHPDDTYYLGDTVIFRWTSANIQNVILGGWDHTKQEYFYVTEDGNGHPQGIPASLGEFSLTIPPNARTEMVDIILWDESDTTFKDRVGPVHLVDTITPKIYLLSPEDGGAEVPPTSKLMLIFTEQVSMHSGNFYLKKADGTLVETFGKADIDSMSKYDVEFYYFTPSTPLLPGTTYYMEADHGVVVDWKGLPFQGFHGPDTWSFTTSATDLYFSEYVEGSTSAARALEIYNPGTAAVNLSKYKMLGNFSAGSWNESNSMVLPNVDLPPGEVYVIARSDAPQSIKDVADMLITNGGGVGQTYLLNYDGSDARALAKLTFGTWTENTLYAIVDMIGVPDYEPGSGWAVAGVAAATKDHTLLRKPLIGIGNSDWAISAGTTKENSEWKVFDTDFLSNLGFPTPNASDSTELLGITLYSGTNNVTVSNTIDAVNYTDNIVVLNGTDPASLTLHDIMLSDGATSLPAEGATIDFTSALPLLVTAEDQITMKSWKITVEVAATPSSEKAILSFSIPEQKSPAEIDPVNHTVDLVTVYGTSLTALVPTIAISAGASITPTPGVATDFTNPVIYAVTAQDGTTQEWTITVTSYLPPLVSIYEIQHTTLPSGNSPLKDQFIRTTGIVTGIDAGYAFFIQDSAKSWNGIYVYVNPTIALGDKVTVTGTVKEYYEMTEISPVQKVEVISSGNNLPDAVTVTPDQVIEPYEGVLIHMTDLLCTNANAGNGMFTLSDGTHTIKVDDDIYKYSAELNKRYTLTGLGHYSYSEWKILPRSVDDVIQVPDNTAPVIGTVTLNPTAPTTTTPVLLSGTITDDAPLVDDSVRLYYGTTAGSYPTEVAFNNTTGNTYSGTIPAQAAGTVYYKITAADADKYFPLKAENTGSFSIVPTGVPSLDEVFLVHIYPNPTTDFVNVSLNFPSGGKITLELYSIVGQLLDMRMAEKGPQWIETFDMTRYGQGTYLLKISYPEGVCTRNIVVR